MKPVVIIFLLMMVGTAQATCGYIIVDTQGHQGHDGIVTISGPVNQTGILYPDGSMKPVCVIPGTYTLHLDVSNEDRTVIVPPMGVSHVQFVGKIIATPTNPTPTDSPNGPSAVHEDPHNNGVGADDGKEVGKDKDKSPKENPHKK